MRQTFRVQHCLLPLIQLSEFVDSQWNPKIDDIPGNVIDKT